MDEFNEILDRCLNDLQLKRATPEACLARYPQQAEQLRTLLPLAVRLTSVPAAQLSTQRRAAIEAQLLNCIAQRPVRPPARQRRSVIRLTGRWSWSMVAAIAVIVCLAGWGVTSATAASLPGEPLYQLKRTAEDLSLSFAPASEQPHMQVQLADQRLAEYTALAARGEIKPDLIVEASTSMAAVLSHAEDSTSGTNQAAIEEVLTAVDARWQTLQGLVAQLPADQHATVTTALASLAANRERALGVLSTRFPDSALLHAKGNIPITPTVTATSEATGTTTTTATSTPVATNTPTAVPDDEATETTTKDKVTPPGLINTPRPKITPPGLINTPQPKITPPGLVNTPRPKNTPPGKSK
ncbi:MAG: DUF5667 domain-containing protein [Anaerolineae bacterium]